MYVIKNALKCIGRSKGRNILIGIIVLVIAISACIGLSIRQASESAKSETLDTMSVTATISFDRQSMMSSMGGFGSFDRSQFAELMNGASSLSLEEYQKYAEADMVKDFYYSMSAAVNGTEGFDPVSTDTDSSQSSGFGGMMGEMMGGMMGSSGDFTIVGYNSEKSMTSFINGTASIVDGTIFEEGTSNNDCIISQELAVYNDLTVGDSITVSNPNSEEELYELHIVGIYTDTASNESTTAFMRSAASDPANKIIMSYPVLNAIVESSAESSTIQTDENTGMEYETKINGTLAGTYVFSNVEDYELFEKEVRNMGLDDSYTVSSPDITEYENSLTPLNTLSTMAGWFLVVILLIGAIILIVLNIFNVRERKYEIGVLTAMGMKKSKVALQFLTEIFVVTLAAVIIGAGIGAVSSVPVTNALLANQVESQQSQSNQIEENFGRGDISSIIGSGGSGSSVFGGLFGSNFETEYVTEISSAMNFTVVLQMLGIAILLTLVAGAVSMIFVMRYEPLKILANRD